MVWDKNLSKRSSVVKKDEVGEGMERDSGTRIKTAVFIYLWVGRVT